MRDLTTLQLNPLQKLFTPEDLGRLPSVARAERVPLERRVAYVHYFQGAVDYWIYGLDPEEEILLAATMSGQGPDVGTMAVRDLLACLEDGHHLERDVAWRPHTPACLAA